MIAVNLIPESRLEGQRRRARLRLWITIAGGYGLFLGVAMIASLLAGSRDDLALRKQLEESTANVESADVHLKRAENDLVEANALLTANRSVGNQPDWSVLLALISGTVEDKIDAMLASKRRMAEELLAGGPEKALTELDTDELMELVALDVRHATS